MKIRTLYFQFAILLLLSIVFTSETTAQCNVTISHSGPDTISASSNCTATLSWGTVSVNPGSTCTLVGTPTFVSAVSGVTNYNVNDPVAIGTNIVVSYTAVINNGATNINTPLSFTLYVRDKTAPVLSGIPASVTVTGCSNTTNPPTVTDNCSSGLIPIYSDAGNISVCGGGTRLRTWSATDAAGNTGYFTQTIVILPDVMPPTISIAATDLLLNCDPANSPTLITNWLNNNGNATAQDCNQMTWSYSPTNPTIPSGCVGNAGVLPVTFTVKDICNNSTTTIAKIISTDVFPPIITQQAQNKVVNCILAAVEINTWLDNYGNATADDACAGASVQAKYTINGTEYTKAQVISFFADSLKVGCQNNILIGSTTYTKVVGKMKIGFVFTDACGNSTAPTYGTFAVTDNIPPTFTTSASNSTIQCNSSSNTTALTNWYNTHGGAVAVDACGSTISYRTVPATLADVQAALALAQSTSCGNTGSVTVSFYAKDACGNEILIPTTATFQIIDNIAPTFTTAPASTTVNCINSGTGNVTALQNFINSRSGGIAADNCNGAVTWSFSWKDKLNNTGKNTYPQIPTTGAGSPPCDWFVDVIYSIKDECNNKDSVSVRFAIQDNTPPVFSNTSADITVDCASIPAPFTDTPTATDNCGSAQITYVPTTINPNNNCAGTFQIKRTWEATDGCGNKSTYTRTISVTDTQVPTIAGVPADATVSCDAVPPVPKIVISDACDIKPDSVFVETSTKGTDSKLCSFYNYTINRKWTATDDCGNVSTKSYTITVNDKTNPSFTAPANITVECFSALNSLVTGKPTAILDNCDSSPKLDSSDVVTAGSCVGNNTITRTWKATDACNNSLVKTQTITTKDTRKPVLIGIPANITLECGDALPAVPTVTVKDSCDNNITPVYVANNLPSSCSGTLQIKREWTATDNCGNVSTKSQTITYLDSKKPIIEVCPSDMTVNNAVGVCEATVALPVPIASDNCGATTSAYNQAKTAFITSPIPGDLNTIVNAATLSFTVPLNVNTTASNVSFDIKLNNIDGEAPTEYFDIYGENNVYLGKTNAATAQCQTSSTVVPITSAQVNAWGQDGTINIVLKPNVPATDPPSYGVNDVCPGANAVGTLKFTTVANTNLVYQYSINNGVKKTINPLLSNTKVLSVGTNLIKYFISDCNNNVDSCQYTVNVLDKEVPTMTAPANQTYTIVGTDCTVLTSIPAPIAMGDNCGFGTGYYQKQPADSLLTFNYDPNLLAYFANDKIFTFSGVTANAVNSNVTLSVELKADAESAGEYFTFLGEDNIPLGQTNNTANCTTKGVTTINIPANKFNTWATDGQLVIKAISNIAFPISQAGLSPGINPCNNTVTANGQNDGSSYMVATLAYNTANPIFSTSGATVTAPKPLFQAGVTQQVTFTIGTTVVKYELSDAAGNTTTATYTVVVNDVTLPVAKCKNAVVYITPLTMGPATINTTDVNNGSTDNCTIASITVTPNSFSCSDIGTTKNVLLTVKDLANNTATCNADVFIQVEKPKSSYSLGICGNDTLRLFANPPAIAGAVYTYQWSGPNQFNSTLENPYIPNASAVNGGTYNLTIKSVLSSSCYEASQTIEVPIDNQPNTPTITSPNTKPCTNGELMLNTAAYTGKKVKYYWYKGIAPSGVLVDSTSAPSYSINNPALGNAKYYVVVKVDACTSNPSASISINPANPPSATLTNASLIEVCEGADVILGTTTVGLGYKYQWTGPDNFTSNTQYPSVITNAKPIKSGVYTLIVSSPEGCESTPALTTVNVKAKPKTPVLVANGLDCEGSTLNLITNITTGISTYHWVNPTFNEQVTTSYNLTLTNLNKTTMKGNWKVYLMNNGCKSDESNVVDVKVNSKPTITADFQKPVCESSSLQLNGIGANTGSYSWSGPNNFVSNAQNPTTNATAGTYIAVIIDQNGCSNFDDVVVTPVAKPEIKTIASNAQPCVTGTADIKLTPTVFPFDTTYAYQWTGANLSSVNKTLVLPNATAAVNGTYTLQVIDKNGCKSEPYSYVVDVRNVPVTPKIDGALTQNVCEGDNILLEVKNSSDYVGASIVYKWNTPAGSISTNIPSLSLSSASAVTSGDYSLKVIVDGCESSLSENKKIVVNAIPAKPTAALSTPLCEGETLQLSTTFVNNAVYEWLGPNNFTSSISNPTKPNVGKDDQGFYKVKIIINGCQSAYSNSEYLTINEVPKIIPIVKNSGAVCLDSPNPFLTLTIESATAVPGATYTWYNANTGTALNTASSSLNYTLSSFTGYTEGINEFYAITTFNGCSTKPSIPTAVVFNKIPADKAFAGADIAVCDNQSIALAAQKPSIGTGVWEQVQGSSITIADPTLATTQVNGLVAGQTYTLQWKLSNGACKNYSLDEVKINVNDTSIKADAGDSIQLCSKTEVNLNANILSSGTTGMWTQSIAQSQLGVVIVNPTNSKSLVTGLTSGNMYAFKWTLSNASCKDYSSDEVFVTVQSPQGTAFAGADFKACGESNILLNATQTPGTLGAWTSLGTAEVVSPNQANSTVKNLVSGDNKFVWAISTKTCGTYSRDTVNIIYENAAKAVPDDITVPYAGTTIFNPAFNDVVPSSGGYTITIVNQPKHGKVVVTQDRKIEYTADNAFAGKDDFEYQICNTTCSNVCSSAKVNVSVNGGDDCTIPTIITPNDDQVNDRWEIPCLVGSDFPNSLVIIFNQWGDEVFRANNYKNDWAGTFNGQPLPAGTYFYIVNFGTTEKKNGFLIIER